MKLPIDTSAITFLAAAPPEAVLDYDSKAPKVDDTGQAAFSVQLVALTGGGAEVLSVKLSGEPKGIAQGAPVKVSGLTAQPWALGDRSGVAFKATRIEPASTGRAS
ncbi:MAG: hypothetical protein ACRDZQ_13885 [Acidimicrobiales bacterium]